ncbi:hypothetical protein, partial [Pseudoalteromonas holothuriae]|uniref:hypothetical protein n=1 Tax=Pseudoalteromonas holothuriae TaxID=2963714 RepID=UPI0021BEE039
VDIALIFSKYRSDLYLEEQKLYTVILKIRGLLLLFEKKTRKKGAGVAFVSIKSICSLKELVKIRSVINMLDEIRFLLTIAINFCL